MLKGPRIAAGMERTLFIVKKEDISDIKGLVNVHKEFGNIVLL